MEEKKANLIIKPAEIPSKAVVHSPGIKGRPDLYIEMYRTAKRHRDQACEVWKNHQALDEEAKKQAFQKNIREEMQESMISMVFSLMCLEGYINTIAFDKLNFGPEKLKSKLTQKWLTVPQRLSETIEPKSPSPFAKGTEPYKSFCGLNTLRNKLVHHNPKFDDIRKTKYGRTEGTINWTNCKKAIWSCQVVVEMVTTLQSQLKQPLPSWLSA